MPQYGDFRRAQENLVLLVLGAVPDKQLSLLHLEKEVFLLWKFHASISEFIHFVAHLKGPYAEEISNSVKEPYFYPDAWEYNEPVSQKDFTGGYVKLTESGKRDYQKLYKEMVKQDKMRSLLAGILIVRTINDDLTPEELLFLIYDTYPDFRTKSEVAKEIYEKKNEIINKLLQQGTISDEKAEELKKTSWSE